jgi:hypothetical protein
LDTLLASGFSVKLRLPEDYTCQKAKGKVPSGSRGRGQRGNLKGNGGVGRGKSGRGREGGQRGNGNGGVGQEKADGEGREVRGEREKEGWAQEKADREGRKEVVSAKPQNNSRSDH